MGTERLDKEKTDAAQLGTVKCSQCHREVPRSAALSRESSDYTLFFCGIDCFDRWSRKNPQRTTRENRGTRSSD